MYIYVNPRIFREFFTNQEVDVMQNLSTPDELLTRKEAAAILKVEPVTLAAWASRGTPKLPFIKVGRLPRYRRSDLEKFLSDNTKTCV